MTASIVIRRLPVQFTYAFMMPFTYNTISTALSILICMLYYCIPDALYFVALYRMCFVIQEIELQGFVGYVFYF